MIDQHIAVCVSKGVEDLIPTYMKNRAKELEILRTTLATGDLKQLTRLGHPPNKPSASRECGSSTRDLACKRLLRSRGAGRYTGGAVLDLDLRWTYGTPLAILARPKVP